MEIIRQPRVFHDGLGKLRMQGRSIGFVPTMGALHEGHLTLVRAARAENDILAASIFINPLQFGPEEDFERYPRDIEGDTEKLRASGADMLFLPDTGSIYPEGFSTSVEVKGLSEKLCGAFRPGHFAGVATVVTKLLNLAGPTRAYFGQKDYAQCLIIKRLVRDLNMDVEIVMCPTVREPDGLAMSSRNQYLNPEERKAAGAIFKCLKGGEEKIKSGTSDVGAIKTLMWEVLRSEPLIVEIQYAGAYDPETLDEQRELKKGGATLLAAAVRIGKTRLIDNIIVSVP